MKLLFLVLVLVTSVMAQQRQWPSHDHHGEGKRTKRTTPQIFPDDVGRFFNQINDCAQPSRGFESPARLREMAREKRDCLREVKRGRR
jgi:hypothetical protein